ncbi:MAG: glycoside hydrolase family 3 N-terminal domain-containing protein [Sulfolobales archaeon]
MSLSNKLSELSLEEKISLVVGVGVARNIPGIAGETRSVRDIPSLELSDGPSGVRIDFTENRLYPATGFPAPILLASTWDPEIVELVGSAIGAEAREHNVDIMLAPGVNIHRHPLCGRNFEYFSEDPYLSGVMGAAYVRGVQREGVGATPKHFVANDQETNRFTIDTIVSERALREIYLRPFEIIVKTARPWAIMASYNKLNGKYTSQNPWLLKQVLRNEWGFDGVVMTDWGAGDNPVEQINSGVDLIMPGSDEIYNRLLDAARRGELDLSSLNQSVERILKLVSKSLKAKGYVGSGRPDLYKHAEIAYRAAAEGVILLKNDNALPLKRGVKIALFGTGQIETLRCGMGSGHNHARTTISILEGLREARLDVDYEISDRYERYILDKKGRRYLDILYRDEIFPEKLDQDIFSEEEIARFAERNDVAIVVITRISGEGWDRKLEKGDFYLSDDERRLLEKVSRQFRSRGKKVIAILNIAGPIEVFSWRDLVDAILLIWVPGQEAGRVVSDVLLGEINPSGKLPITFPRDWSDTPVAKSPECYPGTPPENPSKVIYCEDIFVGYRYYDTYNIQPAYEFGYGLSYTKFEYRDLSVEKRENGLVVRFYVKNTGEFPGREVAQVYIRAMRGKLSKPYQELRGFKKTKLLKPGEEEEITIEISYRDMASFDPDRRKWVVEEGDYEVRVGASSRDIRLRKIIYIEKDLLFET